MGRIKSPERPSPAAEAESRRALIEALERPRYEILPLDGIADDGRSRTSRARSRSR